MNKIIVSLMLVFGVTVISAAPLAQDLYKEAQIQENTARNLEGASQLYQQFLDQPGTDRPMQADAYLHLGLCQAKLGRMAEAKKAWKKIIQDYSDQSEDYSQALSQLQKVQSAEQLAEVQASTTVIQIVHTAPDTRWALGFWTFNAFHSLEQGKPGLGYQGYVGKSPLFGLLPSSLTFFPKPSFGVGLEGGNLFEDFEYVGANVQNLGGSYFYSFYTSVNRSVSYIAATARIETRFWSVFSPYIKAGPGAYRFHFSGDYGDSTQWSPGLTAESGLTLGWSRGLTLNFAYRIHGFVQRTPHIDFSTVSSVVTDGSVTQNHGFRLIGGPSFEFGFRW